MSNLTIHTNDTTTTQKYTLQDFCELTQRGCALKDFPSAQIINSPRGWEKLADACEALVDEADLDIMRDVSYRIKWGIEPVGPSPMYIKLVNAVCDALLSDGPAYDTWIKHGYCLRTIRKTAEEYNSWRASAHSHSHWHCAYVKYRMYLRIYNYRKGHITKCKRFASSIRGYENLIVKLLPNATHWPEEYWLDENNILDELAKVCSYDYRSDLSSYQDLLRLADCPKRMPTNRDWYIVERAANVKQLPSQWVKAIWPTKTDAIITKLFLLAKDMAEEVFNDLGCSSGHALSDFLPYVNYAILAQSWLLTYVNDFLVNQKLPAATRNQVKQAIFEIYMRS